MAVQEQAQCAIEVDASTLGVVVRVNLTFGCAMGDASLEMWGIPFEHWETYVEV